MMYLWTGEVVPTAEVFACWAPGSPGNVCGAGIYRGEFPAVLSVHLTALNANGKAYATDRVYQLNK